MIHRLIEHPLELRPHEGQLHNEGAGELVSRVESGVGERDASRALAWSIGSSSNRERREP